MVSTKKKPSGKKKVKKAKPKVQREVAIKPEMKIVNRLVYDQTTYIIDQNQLATNTKPIIGIEQAGGSTSPYTPRNKRIGGQIQLWKIHLRFKVSLPTTTAMSCRIIIFRMKKGLLANPVIANNILISSTPIGGTPVLAEQNGQAFMGYYPEQLNSGFVVHYDKTHKFDISGSGNSKYMEIKIPKVKGLIQKYVVVPDGNDAYDIVSNQFWMAFLPASDNPVSLQGITVSPISQEIQFYDA